jgi:hypothetical protein
MKRRRRAGCGAAGMVGSPARAPKVARWVSVAVCIAAIRSMPGMVSRIASAAIGLSGFS